MSDVQEVNYQPSREEMTAIGLVALIFIYFMMLVFDFAVLYGFTYLVAERSWNHWWILAAVVISFGSNPRGLIRTIMNPKLEIKDMIKEEL